MSWLVPTVVALPLVMAGALAAAGHFLPPRIGDAISIVVSAAVTVLATMLIIRSGNGPIDYWFGGWQPRDGIALGVSFHVEPLSAGVAAAIGTLMTASQLLAFDYFSDRVPQHYHVLMLVFLAAMVGFALSGDLFNMFVWFELMSFSAFALTGYRIEQPTAVYGAIDFAVLNTIAAFLIAIGTALLYGRTGALNLSQIGEALRRGEPDGLVIVAFTVVVCGFLIKAGAFPFHFWLADAYSVAPAPVGVLFAGVMSDLGLHGVAKIYWSSFGEVLGGPHAGAVRGVLLAVGIATALVGGVMALAQASLKRMLAFVTIAHVGVGLIGIALLTPRGLAGATLYVVADGLVRGALFVAVAHIAYRLGSVDELILHGRGRRLPLTGALFAVGALGIAAIPPLGSWASWGLIAQSAAGIRLPWLAAILILATMLPAAALLRACGRIFLGLGARESKLLEHVAGTEGEPPPAERRPPRRGALFRLPALALLVAGLGLAFAPQIVREAVRHAVLVERTHEVAQEALRGVAPARVPAPSVHASTTTIVYGVVSVLGALGLAAAALWWPRLPRAVRAAPLAVRPLVAGLRSVHDGVVGEYVTWLTFGVAAIGSALALLIR